MESGDWGCFCSLNWAQKKMLGDLSDVFRELTGIHLPTWTITKGFDIYNIFQPKQYSFFIFLICFYFCKTTSKVPLRECSRKQEQQQNRLQLTFAS